MRLLTNACSAYVFFQDIVAALRESDYNQLQVFLSHMHEQAFAAGGTRWPAFIARELYPRGYQEPKRDAAVGMRALTNIILLQNERIPGISTGEMNYLFSWSILLVSRYALLFLFLNGAPLSCLFWSRSPFVQRPPLISSLFSAFRTLHLCMHMWDVPMLQGTHRRRTGRTFSAPFSNVRYISRCL